jgi:hypothetical protein
MKLLRRRFLRITAGATSLYVLAHIARRRGVPDPAAGQVRLSFP